MDQTHFAAWQFDRPEIGEGFAVILRRAKCDAEQFPLALQGLEPKGRYEVQFYRSYDLESSREMAGAELAQLQVNIPQLNASCLVQYRKSGELERQAPERRPLPPRRK
jgi:hypothetical protein